MQPESSPEAVPSMAQGFEIYNKFQALYRSSLICPNCGKQSNTYESYLCLSLPVPQRCLRPVYITVVYLDDDPKQLRIALEMNMFETVKELREKLAFELDVTPKRVCHSFFVCLFVFLAHLAIGLQGELIVQQWSTVS